jgi:hypothetical protein
MRTTKQIEAVKAERNEVLASGRNPEVKALMAAYLERTIRELRAKL